MRFVTSRIEITASPERVWCVLTNFAEYRHWNPFIVRAAGRATAGERLEIEVQTKESVQPNVFRPLVVIAEPSRRLQWVGRWVAPWILVARHDFELWKTGPGMTLVHSETFTGVAPALLSGPFRGLEGRFEAFNAALKIRVEADAALRPSTLAAAS